MSKSFMLFSTLAILGAASLMNAGQSRAAEPALTGDQISTRSGGDLVIRPIKHGTLAMSWNGTTVYVDPADGARAAPGVTKDAAALFAGLPAPDLIVVTHMHPDHFDAAALAKLAVAQTTIVAPQSVVDQLPAELKSRTRALANGQSLTIGKIELEAVPAYNVTEDRLKWHPKGRDNGYVLTLGGQRVYIAGDTEGVPEMRALKNIDIAFVPMVLPFTMTPEAAAEAVNAFKPRIVYPYHYRESDIGSFAKAVASGIEVRQRTWY